MVGCRTLVGTNQGSVALPADERVWTETQASSSDGTDFPCQRVKLVGKRPFVTALHRELTFSNHVHQLNASQDIFGRSK